MGYKIKSSEPMLFKMALPWWAGCIAFSVAAYVRISALRAGVGSRCYHVNGCVLCI